MSVSEVYHIVMHQDDLGEAYQNDFFYQQLAGSGTNTAADLRDIFLADTWTPVRSIISTRGHTNRIQVININRPVDSVDTTIDLNGGYIDAEPTLPTYINAAFRSQRETPGTRYSYKRFAPVRAKVADSDSKWLSSYGGLLEAVGVQLGANLTTGLDTWAPVQVKAGWTLGSAPIVNRAINQPWAFNAWPTHQDSRQDQFFLWLL